MMINGNQNLGVHMMGIFLKPCKNIKVVVYQMEWVIMAQAGVGIYNQRFADCGIGSLRELVVGLVQGFVLCVGSSLGLLALPVVSSLSLWELFSRLSLREFPP
jgi:hypothetical protein